MNVKERKRYETKIKDTNGTTFQKKVWLAILNIPRGQVLTYSEIANSIGKPNAVRAVANACGKNPFAPHVPCHRVVGATGIGGYSGKGGITQKRRLLRSESIDAY